MQMEITTEHLGVHSCFTSQRRILPLVNSNCYTRRTSLYILSQQQNLACPRRWKHESILLFYSTLC